MSELYGCVNDVKNMYDLLSFTMGFPEEGITMLVDAGDLATEDNFPSKENIEVSSSSLPQVPFLITRVV
jgi:hypothetical protein